VSQPPSFVPRDLLVVPGYFETQEPKNLQWHLATDYLGAVRLAWAMQQQELANAMFHLRTTAEKTIPEVAAILGIQRRQLWSKLTGRSPAQEDDLITWSWMTDTPRRTAPLRELLEDPSRVHVPRLGQIRLETLE
jgi:hypothetical protein